MRPACRTSPRLGSALLLCAALLSACGVAPRRDGPGANPPADLERVPDAVPQPEAIRPGGPNKPYAVDGQTYVPKLEDLAYRERGLASWYGAKFHGRSTSNGETYDMYAMTAAHKTWPLPSYARVRNPANEREVIVRINDRGPFVAGRVIDLSYTAALRLGLLRGVGMVEIERITQAEIRAGTWRRGDAAPTLAEAPPAAQPAPTVSLTTLSAAQPAPTVSLTTPSAAPPAPPAPTAAPADDPPADSAALARSFGDAARGWWVQLGAFRDRARAQALQDQAAQAVVSLAPLLAIFEERSLHRLQAGPYPNLDEARIAAAQIGAALALTPQLVERR